MEQTWRKWRGEGMKMETESWERKRRKLREGEANETETEIEQRLSHWERESHDKLEEETEK